jgi:hypothetical protein
VLLATAMVSATDQSVISEALLKEVTVSSTF